MRSGYHGFPIPGERLISSAALRRNLTYSRTGVVERPFSAWEGGPIPHIGRLFRGAPAGKPPLH
ncbi:MAG: hypothetical protein C5B51_21090 [Terriglobia bacterium]|nr:MAG: hypothetical protein C5B51_21090 [Terriglobia bacterium]